MKRNLSRIRAVSRGYGRGIAGGLFSPSRPGPFGFGFSRAFARGGSGPFPFFSPDAEEETLADLDSRNTTRPRAGFSFSFSFFSFFFSAAEEAGFLGSPPGSPPGRAKTLGATALRAFASRSFFFSSRPPFSNRRDKGAAPAPVTFLSFLSARFSGFEAFEETLFASRAFEFGSLASACFVSAAGL